MRIALPRLVNTGLVVRPGGRADELLGVTRSLVAELAPNLVVFPELSACGYPGLLDRDADAAGLVAVAEPVPGPTTAAFVETAVETSCAVVFGLCELDPGDGQCYNTLVWADPTGTVASYRKIHLTAGEQRHMSAGSGAAVIDTAFGRVGLSACYDKMFPQVYERQRERGAEISVIASAWSSRLVGDVEPVDVLAEQSALFDRARAAETGMLVISTNYDGPKVPGSADRFCGGLRVIDGLGRVIEPVVDTGAVAVWDVDPVQCATAVHTFNDGDFFTRDRRLVR